MTKARAWELTDEALVDELGRFSYWWGIETNEGKIEVYPGADNKDEALALIAEAVARMAKIILGVETSK